MNPRAEIWNVFHDGELSSLEGNVPGDVTIRIGIEYLRHMFSGEGEDIFMTLHSCSKISMEIWESDLVTDDFGKIAEIGSEILSTDSEDIPVRVITTLGTLHADFESFSLRLDDGREITYDQLCDACQKYWDRWEGQAEEAKNLA